MRFVGLIPLTAAMFVGGACTKKSVSQQAMDYNTAGTNEACLNCPAHEYDRDIGVGLYLFPPGYKEATRDKVEPRH